MILWDNEAVGTQRTTLQDFTPPLGYTVDVAASAAWEDNPVVRAYQWGRSKLANDGAKLDANALDDLIKGAGVKNFVLPADQYSNDAAALLIERQRQKQIAADIDARTPYSWGETPVRALTRAATMLVDPLNLAAMFIPGVGPEYFAARIAATTSRLGRFGVRAMEGAATGAVGMGALELAQYPLAQALHDDYTSADSLVNMLSGAALGGVLHGVGGTLLERGRVARAPDAEVPRPPPDVMRAPPEVNEAAARTAVAQLLQDQPVTVEHLYTAARDADTVTVYRGQYAGPPQNVPEWIQVGLKENGTLDAQGRWWTESPEIAKWYADDAGAHGAVVAQDVPRQVVEASRVSKAPPEIQGFSRDATNELYLPPEYRAQPRAKALTPEELTTAIAQQREALTTNRARNILDSDRPPVPPRPAQPTPAATAENANPELTARLADAQARATTATQQAEAAVQQLQERMAPKGTTVEAKVLPELVAADADIARAAAEAKAFENIVNCQRFQ